MKYAASAEAIKSLTITDAKVGASLAITYAKLEM
jgi:hypothetical protein